MPARSPGLPEGTDHIINGAMETGAGTGASTGSTGTGASTGSTGVGSAASSAGTASASGASGTSGFVASGGGKGKDTGGTLAGGGTGSSTTAKSQSGGGSAVSGAADKLVGQVKEQVSSLRSQATDKAYQYADTGKEKVTSTLDDISEIINDAARSVDARLGDQYGQYAHRAADAVSSFTQSLRGKSVDELVDDTRSAVRKSPGIAVGTAAVLGFALMRVVKAGMPITGDETGSQGGPESSQAGSGRGTTGTSG